MGSYQIKSVISNSIQAIERFNEIRDNLEPVLNADIMSDLDSICDNFEELFNIVDELIKE